MQKLLAGEPLDGESVNRVDEVPKAFKDWVTDNKERIKKAKERGTLPYFLRDNDKMVIDMRPLQKKQFHTRKSATSDEIWIK